MKKGIKTLAAAALAVSALTPVAAAAASNIADGVYTSTDYYTLPAFKQLSTTDKAAALQSTGAVVVLGGQAYKATDVLSATDAQLPTLGTAADTYTTAAGNKLVSGQKLDTPTTPVPGELKVESVSAINASELVVTFDKAPTAEAAQKANYEVKVNGASVGTPADVKVDGNTAILRLTTALAPGNKYVVQVNNKVLKAPFTSESKLFEAVTAPKLVSTAKVGDTLRFTFDKPVENTSTTLVKLDGLALSDTTLALVGSNVAKNYTYEVALTGSTEKDKASAVGKHQVVLFDIAESSASLGLSTTLPAVASVLNGDYTVTTTAEVAPIVEALIPVNGNKFFIQTNQPVSVVAESIVVKKGNHTFETGTTIGTDTSKLFFEQGSFTPSGTSTAKDGYYVVITDKASTDINPLYATGETSVNLNVTVKNFKNAKDVLGAPYNGTVTLSQSLNKPTAKVKSFVENTKTAVIEFGGVVESADATPFDLTDVVVRDKNGVVLKNDGSQYTFTPDGSKEATLVVTDTTKEGPFTVDIKADSIRYKEDKTSIASYQLSGAKNDLISLKLETTATNIFKYKEFSTAVPANNPDLATDTKGIDYANNEVTIYFADKMDASAKNPANYLLDGKALPEGTTVDFVGDTKTVKLTFPKNTFSIGTDYRLTVSNAIKNEAGEFIVKDLQTKESYVATFKTTDNVKPVLTSATYVVPGSSTVNTNKLLVTFDEAISLANATKAIENLDVKVNSNTIKVASVATAASKTVLNQEGTPVTDSLIITLAENVNTTQAATITVVEHPSAAEFNAIFIKDADGNEAKANVSVTSAGKNVYDAGFTTALADVNGGTAGLQDFVDAGITGVTSANKTAVEGAIATAKGAKGSALTASEAQTVVNNYIAAALEAAKYETSVALTGKSVSADIDADVIKLKAGKTASTSATITNRVADNTAVQVTSNKFTVKAVGGSAADQTFDIEVGSGNTKVTVTVTVAVTIAS